MQSHWQQKRAAANDRGYNARIGIRLRIRLGDGNRQLGKPVFRPGIGGIAVAANFPETRLIFGNEFNRANKLGPFPTIKLRDNHARGSAVIARNRFAIELRGHEHIVIERVFDSDIGGIAIVAAKENVTHFRFRFHNFRQREKGDTAPVAIEFAPGGDAMEIGDVFELRESIEFLPGECLRIFH